MEDTADVLQWVAEVAPAVMERSQNEELLMFVVLFLGSADYLKNPFLRAKLVDVRRLPLCKPRCGPLRAGQAEARPAETLMEHLMDPRPTDQANDASLSALLQVLHAWIPADAIDPDLAAQRHSATANSVIYLMEGHDVVQKYMVSNGCCSVSVHCPEHPAPACFCWCRFICADCEAKHEFRTQSMAAQCLSAITAHCSRVQPRKRPHATCPATQVSFAISGLLRLRLGLWQATHRWSCRRMQVRSLLSLFVDIETTDRSNAFYEKFNTRYKAGQILGVCLHRASRVSSCLTPDMLARVHAGFQLLLRYTALQSVAVVCKGCLWLHSATQTLYDD